jgi:esterase/lipase superfamily enzyme
MTVTQRWYSDRLGQDLTVVRWGFAGKPVLVFPTAGGDAEEIERNELVGHLWPLIDAGRVRVFSCDSVAGQALMERRGEPTYRLWLFDQFHQAVAHEVVPAIRGDIGSADRLVVAGASIGAFNALAVLCRWPDLFDAAICMSGTYRIDQLVDGQFSEHLYYSSPMHFLPGLEGPDLESLRHRFVVLASGAGRWEDISQSWAMADVLGAKGVPNRVDDWGPRYDHDWPTWWQMLPTYLKELVP